MTTSSPRFNVPVGGFSIRNIPPDTMMYRSDNHKPSSWKTYASTGNYRLVVFRPGSAFSITGSSRFSTLTYCLLDVAAEKILFAAGRALDHVVFNVYNSGIWSEIRCEISDYHNKMCDEITWDPLEVEVYLEDKIIFSLEDKDDFYTQSLPPGNKQFSYIATELFQEINNMINSYSPGGRSFAKRFINFSGGMFYFKEGQDLLLGLKTTTGDSDYIKTVCLSPSGFIKPLAFSRSDISYRYHHKLYVAEGRRTGQTEVHYQTPVVPADMVFYLDGCRIGDVYFPDTDAIFNWRIKN